MYCVEGTALLVDLYTSSTLWYENARLMKDFVSRGRWVPHPTKLIQYLIEHKGTSRPKSSHLTSFNRSISCLCSYPSYSHHYLPRQLDILDAILSE